MQYGTSTQEGKRCCRRCAQPQEVGSGQSHDIMSAVSPAHMRVGGAWVQCSPRLIRGWCRIRELTCKRVSMRWGMRQRGLMAFSRLKASTTRLQHKAPTCTHTHTPAAGHLGDTSQRRPVAPSIQRGGATEQDGSSPTFSWGNTCSTVGSCVSRSLIARWLCAQARRHARRQAGRRHSKRQHGLLLTRDGQGRPKQHRPSQTQTHAPRPLAHAGDTSC
jgi:hypothetical protein